MFNEYKNYALERCPFCSRTFNADAFKVHQRICTEDRPQKPAPSRSATPVKNAEPKMKEAPVEYTPNKIVQEKANVEKASPDTERIPNLCKVTYNQGNSFTILHILSRTKTGTRVSAKRPQKKDLTVTFGADDEEYLEIENMTKSAVHQKSFSQVSKVAKP